MSSADSVLADLSQAESHARLLREEWEQQKQQQKQTLQDAEERVAALQAQLVGVQETNAALAQRLQATQREVEQERRNTDEQCAAVKAEAEQQQGAIQTQVDAQRAHAASQRERNKQLEEVLKELHATFYTGNVYALILKACLIITGATRGVYVTTKGGDSPLRIRAAIDVDGYPQSPPSDFLQALCRKVLDDDETFLARTEEDFAGLPEPKAPTEHFHNCLVAPVSLLANLSGIVICADKMAESFDEHDVESVLAVGNQATIAAENEHLRRQLQQAYLGTVSVMADAMEAKDSYTHGHSEMVSRHARLIARHLNLTEEERSIISYAALLHDIGKIGVSDGLLNKPGPLLPEERELVRTHVRLGHDLIGHVPALQPVAEAVLHHHECYDGTGYPSGLVGDAIP
ncbi:MAG: HD domain-containing protein, partial [Armatimonadota bacterium]|nr:HD domain-containing protein [Armatimonadota bacterium]